MNSSKFFGSRPIFYFAEPGASAGSDGGAASGGAAAGGGAGGSGGSGGGAAAPPVSDEQFLSAPDAAASPDAKTPEAVAAETPDAAPEEINLEALEEAQPEWLAKVTDEAAKTEIGKLLAYQKKVAERFKDEAALDAFFKDLPGGTEQVAALQMLGKEVGEIDAHIAANTAEGNATVAERYLSEAPDGGVGLFRAGAQHLAKSQPEAWSKIGGELVNETLKSSGIGADLGTVVSAVQEMRAAIQKDDGEAFGKAAAKLLGEPQKAAPADPAVAKAAETAKADAERVKAQGESWSFRQEKSIGKIANSMAAEAGKLLSKVLPASISEKDRDSLRNDIAAEVRSQLQGDKWLNSKLAELIGDVTDDGKGGRNYAKANLRAGQGEWDKATELILATATPQLIGRAVSKIVSQWSRDRAASNKDARDKAKGAAPKTDVGAGKTPANGKGKPPLTPEQFRKMSDEEFLSY